MISTHETTTTNRITHEIPDWVKIYSSWSHLLKPEVVILDKLKSQLSVMKMLDIGVGGGRTSCHFASLAKEYVGIDFDNNMVNSCETRFHNHPGNFSFKYCNAKSMEIFESEYFDFILFSFNGLDYLGHEDRQQALKEIRRVCKSGGYFFFSTHNLNSLERLFSLSRNPLKLPISLWRNFVLRARNGHFREVKDRDYAIIYDGEYSFKLRWLLISIWKRLGYFYYSKPEEHLRQLKESGFQILNIYMADGEEVSDLEELNRITDYWIHYFCQATRSNE